MIELRDGQPPRLAYIEVGMPAVARRLHPRFEHWIAALQSKWGARQGTSFRIPCSQVCDFGIGGVDIVIDLEAEATPVLAWEKWLREQIINRIPGAG